MKLKSDVDVNESTAFPDRPLFILDGSKKVSAVKPMFEPLTCR